eukprot:SAG25_NODE_170_length_13039_cov_23.733153_14_plen_91_part_00
MPRSAPYLRHRRIRRRSSGGGSDCGGLAKARCCDVRWIVSVVAPTALTWQLLPFPAGRGLYWDGQGRTPVAVCRLPEGSLHGRAAVRSKV